MAIEKVIGYVDGQPVYYSETEPTKYETTAAVEEKGSYDVSITAEDNYGNFNTVQSFFYVAGTWIEPIVDRNALDIQNKDSLRAYLNYWDMNRIEMDTEYLADILNDYGYNQSLSHNTDWLMSDFPYSSQMERIRLNVQTLINVYHAQKVPLPVTLQGLDWIKLNDLENNLKLMKEMIGRMEQSFRYSGTFYCGQEVSF